MRPRWNSSVHFISQLHTAQGNVFSMFAFFLTSEHVRCIYPGITVLARNSCVSRAQSVCDIKLLGSREEWAVTKATHSECSFPKCQSGLRCCGQQACACNRGVHMCTRCLAWAAQDAQNTDQICLL